MRHQVNRLNDPMISMMECIVKLPAIWNQFRRTSKVLLLLSLAVVYESSYAQTNGCDEGVIRLPDRNGTIQICSAIAGQVPQLTQQLKDAVRTLGGQETQIKELTRLVKGLNGSSQSIGEERQAQMLKTLSSELAKTQRNGDDRTRQMLSGLTQQLEDFQNQLTTSLTNTVTAAVTQASLKGDVGNSISKLEFSSASRQLDEISAKLGIIDGRVQDVKTDTTDIRRKLDQMQIDRDKQKQKDEQFLADMQRVTDTQQQVIHEAPSFLFSKFRDKNNPSIWMLSLKFRLIDRPSKNLELIAIGYPDHSPPWLIDLSKSVDQTTNGGRQNLFGIVDAPPGRVIVCMTGFDPKQNKRMTLSVMSDAILENGLLMGFELPTKTNYESEPYAPCNKNGLSIRQFTSQK